MLVIQSIVREGSNNIFRAVCFSITSWWPHSWSCIIVILWLSSHVCKYLTVSSIADNELKNIILFLIMKGSLTAMPMCKALKRRVSLICNTNQLEHPLTHLTIDSRLLRWCHTKWLDSKTKGLCSIHGLWCHWMMLHRIFCIYLIHLVE